jgi:hypothetical protein
MACSDGDFAYRTVAGVQPHRSFSDPIVVAPQDTWDGSYDFNVAHLAPENAVQLHLTRGGIVVIRWLLIIDNAGKSGTYDPVVVLAQEESGGIAGERNINQCGGQADEGSKTPNGQSFTVQSTSLGG